MVNLGDTDRGQERRTGGQEKKVRVSVVPSRQAPAEWPNCLP